MHEEGRIPYASVAWPGLVGVVTGMNAEGLALVVHGARAGEPRSVGEPVVHTMREVLGRARDVNAALPILAAASPMVSHMVAVGEESGQLETMLEKIADFYDAEVDAKVKALTSLIEPIMIVFMGTVVGGMVIAMYLPMFKLINVVAGGH